MVLVKNFSNLVINFDISLLHVNVCFVYDAVSFGDDKHTCRYFHHKRKPACTHVSTMLLLCTDFCCEPAIESKYCNDVCLNIANDVLSLNIT